MNIIITNTTGQPIYDQIVTQIKNMIISGELKEGDALPSMRFLAKELKISVITTKRAYEELEKEGFIIRKVSEQDKRTRHLYPTQKAKDACEKIFSIASEWEKKIFKDMTEEEKEGFLDQFLKISRNIVAELEKEEGSA